MSTQKVLYFEGAGMPGTGGEVGNCRIRTAFKAANGKAYYLEIEGNDHGKEWRKYHPEFKNVPIIGFISFCYEITGDADDCNKHRHKIERSFDFPYTEKNILNIVNKNFGTAFGKLLVLPDLSGYRVHGGCISGVPQKNLMDDFNYDEKVTEAAKAIVEHHCQLERDNGVKWPCVTAWRDGNSLRTLRIKHPKSDYPWETYRYSTVLKQWVCVCSAIHSW